MLFHPSHKSEFEETKFGFNSSSSIRSLKSSHFKTESSFDFQARSREQGSPVATYRDVPAPLGCYISAPCCYGAWLLISERRWLGSRRMNINWMTPLQYQTLTHVTLLCDKFVLWITTAVMWLFLSNFKPPKSTSKKGRILSSASTNRSKFEGKMWLYGPFLMVNLLRLSYLHTHKFI